MTPRTKKNTEKVAIFLPPEALEKLREEADKKGSNVSAVIRMIVLDYVGKK